MWRRNARCDGDMVGLVLVNVKGQMLSLGFVFFFQAEDGIRDPLVTGVQTCALPISGVPRRLVLTTVARGRFVKLAAQRGLVRDRRRADGRDADVRGSAVAGKAQRRQLSTVANGHDAVDGPGRIYGRPRDPPEPIGEWVRLRTDDAHDERLGQRPRDRIRVACPELAPLAVLADEAP